MNAMPNSSTVELIENGQIILVTQVGQIDYHKAKVAIEKVIQFLNQAKSLTHLISDMSQATLLPEAAELTSSELLKKMENHPMFGVATMILRDKNYDLVLENTMNDYNRRIWKKEIFSPGGKFRRTVISFHSVEAARDFLVSFDDTRSESDDW